MDKALCGTVLGLVGWLALLFLVVALAIGTISAFKALGASKPGFGTARAANAPAITPLLEALKGLVEALGSAPAWFALFLAGIFLLWIDQSAYVDACKPAEAKVTRTFAETITTTRSETPKPNNPTTAPANSPSGPKTTPKSQ